MRISLSQSDNELMFTVELNAGDHDVAQGQHHGITLEQNTFRFVLPQRLEGHPDLLATALLTVVLPFAGRQIEMPMPVSATLADAVHRAFNLEVSPVSSQLEVRKPGSRPGLAFSGGVDSLASMLLMPDETALVFSERIAHPHADVPDDFNTYNPQAAIEAFNSLERQSGKKVHRIQSDHEYIIGPSPDWVTWAGVGAPLVLMADVLDLDSLWFGSVIGSVYLPDWNAHRYFSWDDVVDPWQLVASAVALPVARPVSGISEIGTSKIVEVSPYADISISCGNGQDGQPCMRCSKCLRKLLIRAVLKGCAPDRLTLQRFAEQPAVQHSMSDKVLDYIFMYCFAKLPPLSNMYFRRIQKAVQAIAPDVDFLERWYPRSLEHIPVQYRSDFLARKSQYLQDCTEQQVAQIESWEPVHFVAPEPGLSERMLTFGRRVPGGVRRRTRRFGSQVLSSITRTISRA